MRHLALLLLAGCVRLAHVEPAPRDSINRGWTAVRITSKCGWNGISHEGQGVLISERHALTAYHVVGCAEIPRVWITTHDGYRHRAVVTEEHPRAGIAKLELAHAGRFGFNIPPPALAGPWYPSEYVTDDLCAEIADEPPVCGRRLEQDLFEVRLEHGDSGAGVYDDNGYLVGLVSKDVLPDPGVRGWRRAARVAIVGVTWLNGT